MKTACTILLACLITILCINICFGNSIEQTSYRWRNDDGDVYNATWKDSVDTPIILTGTENLRLRIQITADNEPVSSNIFLVCSEDMNKDYIIPVTGSDTGNFSMSPSQYLSDLMVYTDNQLFPCADIDFKYWKTVTLDSTNKYYFTSAGNNDLYEFEYSIKPPTNIKPGSVYLFGITMDNPGSLLWGEHAVLMTPPVSWLIQPIGKMRSNYKYIINDLAFIDSNTGIIVGFKTTYKFDYSAATNLILKTTNGGATWTEQACPSEEGGELRAICYTSANIGTAVGSKGTILRTTNGGKDWVRQNSGTDGFLISADFTNNDTGNVIGLDLDGNFFFLRTTNGGMTWSNQYLKNKDGYLSKVFFLNADTGYVVGRTIDDGLILKTTDGGKNWNILTTGSIKSWSYFDVYFTDPGNGYIAGPGKILKTTDGGGTWTESYNGFGYELLALHFINKNTGWAVGEYGWIIKTTDGGQTWNKLVRSVFQTLRAVQFIDENTGWIVCDRGKMLKTNNGGMVTLYEEKTQKPLPKSYYLQQNYPNPFNPSTIIEYSLAKPGRVSIEIYDLLGRLVNTVVNKWQAGGDYKINWTAKDLPSGIYFYRIKSGDYIEAKKMILIK